MRCVLESVVRPSLRTLITLMLLVVLCVSGCHAPGPEVILIPALPLETEPMLTAEPITLKVLVWNSSNQAFDISKKVTVPAGMTLHFVPIDEIIADLKHTNR
jgi:hypothetical protein